MNIRNSSAKSLIQLFNTATDSDSIIKILDSTFEDNIITINSPILLQFLKGSIDISGNTFQNNQALLECGGIFILSPRQNSTIELHQNKFLNSTAHNGGAIWIQEGSQTSIIIDSCYFEGLVSLNFGGAMFISSTSSDIIVQNSTFNQIVGNIGGVFYLTWALGFLKFSNVFIQEATSKSNAGCFMIDFADRIEILDSNFYGCKSQEGNGGLIYSNYAFYEIIIKNITISDCSALLGSIVYSFSSQFSLENSIIRKSESNDYEISFYFTSSNLTIISSDIEISESFCSILDTNLIIQRSIFTLDCITTQNPFCLIQALAGGSSSMLLKFVEILSAYTSYSTNYLLDTRANTVIQITESLFKNINGAFGSFFGSSVIIYKSNFESISRGLNTQGGRITLDSSNF